MSSCNSSDDGSEDESWYEQRSADSSQSDFGDEDDDYDNEEYGELMEWALELEDYEAAQQLQEMSAFAVDVVTSGEAHLSLQDQHRASQLASTTAKQAMRGTTTEANYVDAVNCPTVDAAFNHGAASGHTKKLESLESPALPLCKTNSQSSKRRAYTVAETPEDRSMSRIHPTGERPVTQGTPTRTRPRSAVTETSALGAIGTSAHVDQVHVPIVCKSNIRGPKRLKVNSTWTNEELQKAVADVDNGVPVRAAARAHRITPSTLRGHIYGTTLNRQKGRKRVLTLDEEKQLVEFLIKMQELGIPYIVNQLQEKVGILTLGRLTPFQNGVPSPSWVRCFRKRHPQLSVGKAQSLDNNRAINLCPQVVAGFYKNLQTLYKRHNYKAHQIWNCDESAVQAGRDGGAYVIARKGSRHVQKITPDSREWLTVLSCVNANGEYIPNYYIFKGIRASRNFIVKTGEGGAAMAMQAKGWITNDLFMEWMIHFLYTVGCMYDISESNRHLLILNGHGLHITMDVITLAKSKGLDLVTIPSHTSHELQPLDVCCFKPFTFAFRAYRDKWTLSHASEVPIKEDIAQWVSRALRRAMTPANIIQGFECTGIFPFNSKAMDSKMTPTTSFFQIEGNVCPVEPTVASVEERLADWEIQEIFDEVEQEQPFSQQYYVQVDQDDEANKDNDGREVPATDHDDRHDEEAGDGNSNFSNLLQLPRIPLPPKSTARMEAIIDYQHSIVFTEDHHINEVQTLGVKRLEATEERLRWQTEKEAMKELRAQQKVEKQQAKIARAEMEGIAASKTKGQKANIPAKHMTLTSERAAPAT